VPALALVALTLAASAQAAGQGRSDAIDRAAANVRGHAAAAHFGADQSLVARDVVIERERGRARPLRAAVNVN